MSGFLISTFPVHSLSFRPILLKEKVTRRASNESDCFACDLVTCVSPWYEFRCLLDSVQCKESSAGPKISEWNHDRVYNYYIRWISATEQTIHRFWQILKLDRIQSSGCKCQGKTSNNSHRDLLSLISPSINSRLSIAHSPKLQAPVYDILPPATAVVGYPIDLRQPSANRQFFLGAQWQFVRNRQLKLYQAFLF